MDNTTLSGLLGGYTETQLSEAFDMIRPTENWKMPIDAVIRDNDNVELVQYACMFYTGDYGTVTDNNDGTYRIRAPGYYMTIGA